MKKEKIKAYIEPDNKSTDALWLVVEKEGSASENTAHPILKEEVEAIMLACLNYLVRTPIKMEDETQWM